MGVELFSTESLRAKMGSHPRNLSSAVCVAFAILAAGACLRTVTAQTVWESFNNPSIIADPLRIDRGSTGLWQTLMKLHTRASLLMLVAHPDDEDGALLAYESRGEGARTILLTLNRGEGGQNVMSSAYWDALGILRTEELLAADQYYGVQQYFGRVVDFGFSKTQTEAMQKWGHERVLEDAVRLVRLTRPLVITSVWVGGPSDGHGQHEVSGEIAQEAFKAAADPRVFPEQVQDGLQPWQALKVYERVPTISITKKGMYDYASRRWYPVGVYDYINQRFLTGIPMANVNVPEGEYSPLLGSSYAEIGAEGLNQQKSQNGGVGALPLGARAAGYHRYASVPPADAHEGSFFDGIDTSLMGIAGMAPGGEGAFLRLRLASVNQLVEQAIRQFSADHPERIAPTLARGLEAVRELLRQVESRPLPAVSKYNVEFELHVKQNQFNTALVQALGLAVRATVVPQPHPARTPSEFGQPATFQVAVPGQSFWVSVRTINPSQMAVSLKRVSVAALQGERWTILPQKPPASMLAANKPVTALFKVLVPQDAAYTQPYYSRPDIEQPYYNVLDQHDVNLPSAPYPLSAWTDLTFQGVRIRIGQVVQTVKRERGLGEVMEPLVVGPAISVWVSPHAGMIPLGQDATSLTLTLEANTQGRAKGLVRLDLPPGWSSSPSAAPFDIAGGEDQAVSFRVIANDLEQQEYRITAVAQYNGHEYNQGFESIGYPGLRPYNHYRAATYRVTGVDIKIPKGLNVGYIVGTGDRVPESLESMGVAVHLLTADDLATSHLQPYDAIVLGVRAYAARQDVKMYNRRLLDYVQNGGVLIVQYNTPEYDHNYGPYPCSLTQNPEVVVDEDSPVNILSPSNPLLSWPNKIRGEDFAGWFEERGHGFMAKWDPRYEALLETHDPDQPPQKGGLLYARYGKGIYIYEAYALYRQLPEGVPGAYRMMANMVSLDRNPLREH